MAALPKYVIRTTSPLRSNAIIGFLCLCLLALGYYCWQLLQQQDIQKEHLTQQIEQHKEQEQSQSIQQRQAKNEMDSQLQQLSQKASNGQQKSQALAIQEATNEQLENQLGQLQDQVLELEKELSFYSAATHGSSSGLQIQKLQLFTDDPTQPQQLRYRLILTQGQRIDAPLQGSAMLQLPANGDNVLPTVLAETDFKLRYVQVIEGYFTLEPGTTPAKIAVILSQKGEPSRLQSFDWQLTSNNPTQSARTL